MEHVFTSGTSELFVKRNTQQHLCDLMETHPSHTFPAAWPHTHARTCVFKVSVATVSKVIYYGTWPLSGWYAAAVAPRPPLISSAHAAPPPGPSSSTRSTRVFGRSRRPLIRPRLPRLRQETEATPGPGIPGSPPTVGFGQTPPSPQELFWLQGFVYLNWLTRARPRAFHSTSTQQRVPLRLQDDPHKTC